MKPGDLLEVTDYMIAWATPTHGDMRSIGGVQKYDIVMLINDERSGYLCVLSRCGICYVGNYYVKILDE
jgi:hypothetical protein